MGWKDRPRYGMARLAQPESSVRVAGKTGTSRRRRRSVDSCVVCRLGSGGETEDCRRRVSRERYWWRRCCHRSARHLRWLRPVRRDKAAGICRAPSMRLVTCSLVLVLLTLAAASPAQDAANRNKNIGTAVERVSAHGSGRIVVSASAGKPHDSCRGRSGANPEMRQLCAGRAAVAVVNCLRQSNKDSRTKRPPAASCG